MNILNKIQEGSRKIVSYLVTCGAYTGVILALALILRDKIEVVDFSDITIWLGLGYAAIAAVFFAANAVEHIAKAYGSKGKD